MLGKLVTIAIDHTKKGYISKVGTSIYLGNILEGSCKCKDKPVYLITKRYPGENFRGIVVGILNKDDPVSQHFIVAPKGHIYYEPEIRSMLSKVKHKHINSLQCRYEKSCGAVVFNVENDEIRFLLVKNKNASHWGFPKGHVERGETEYQTALREIKEETGLEVKIMNGFREISDYYSFGSAKKRVVFFLAKSNSKKVNLQLDELGAYMWTTYENALNSFEFKNNVIILKRAMNFIKQKRLKAKRELVTRRF